MKTDGEFPFSAFVDVMLKYGFSVYWVLEIQNMPAIEVGRICTKQIGRESGKRCVIIDVMDKSFVLVTGPKKVSGVRRRRVNINHVMPLVDKVEVKRGASDEEVTQALDAASQIPQKAAAKAS